MERRAQRGQHSKNMERRTRENSENIERRTQREHLLQPNSATAEVELIRTTSGQTSSSLLVPF